MKVGIVGLGEMGLPMAERMLAASLPLTFYARRPEVVARVAALGGDDAGSLAGVASVSDVVIVCVYSDAQTREVALGPGGLVTAMTPGSTLVVHTTGSPTTVADIAAVAASRGVRVVDAPVSGGPARIRAGAITLLVGGEAEALEHARPALAAYGNPILHVGDLGSGQRIKLLNNALFAAHIALAAEAERVATGLGVDPAQALGALRHCSGDSAVLGVVRDVGSTAELQRLAGRFVAKDVATVTEVAAELGVDLGLLGTAAHRAAGEAPDGTPSLERLWDLEQIKQLKARYFRLLDTKDWDAFASLFTDDCQHHLPQESPKPYVRNDEYFRDLRVQLGNGVTTHHGHMPEITFLSDTEAEGIWAMFDYVQVEPPSGPVSIQGYGHYFETYRKCTDGAWRISSKRNVRLRLDRVPPPRGR